jgi:hypothetical protein
MNTLSVNLRYRPIKFGWCIKKADFAGLRRAVKLSFTMWGGCYNPIIPIDDTELANALISLFRVDALAPTSDDEEVRAFIKTYKHLPWPLIGDDFFVEGLSGRKQARVVDICHPIEKLHEEYFRSNPNPHPLIDVIKWDTEDPLADVLLLSFGTVPDAAEVGMDYLGLARERLWGTPAVISNGGDLPPLEFERMSVASLNKSYLRRHYLIRNQLDNGGLYVGQANDFEDLVTFWNLRAADIEVRFHDPSHAGRFRISNQVWTNNLIRTYGEDRDFIGIALWHRRKMQISDHPEVGARVMDRAVVDQLWSGLNIQVPLMYFSEGSTLASVSDLGERPHISFSLTGQPFSQDRGGYDENYVLSVSPVGGLFNERATLHAPFLPPLNRFYGENCHFAGNKARAEPDGLGIIIPSTMTALTLRSMSVAELIAQVFESVGIEAAPSKPGLVGATLIRQMGGLDGCRTFKIAGVRTLIENFRPDQSFSRACAMQTIHGQSTNHPLSSYQWLYIEPRKSGSSLTRQKNSTSERPL